jgi:photosystem II stability/assembly factor-like uncharacterized protein
MRQLMLLALVAALAGCGGAPRRPQRAVTAPVAATLTAKSEPTAKPSPLVPVPSGATTGPTTLVPVFASVPSSTVTLADRWPGVGVVGILHSTEAAQRGTGPRLELTTDFRDWRDVTPLTVRRQCDAGCELRFESAFFANPATGWVTTFDPSSEQDVLYATTDGGQTWHQQLRTEHTLDAGARAAIWFLTPSIGWVAMLEPAGPSAIYWHTADGGKRWTELDRSSQIPPLPFTFVTPAIGYAGENPDDPLAGVYDLRGIWRTTDSGQEWTNQSVRLPFKYATASRANCDCTRPIYGRPVFDGAHGVMPVLLPAGSRADLLAFYRTADNGQHWTLTATLHANTATVEVPGTPPQPLEKGPLISIAEPQTWWVADLTGTDRPTHFRIRITRNGGQTWTTTQSDLPLDTVTLQSTSDTSAWATTEIRVGDHPVATELEQTTDGGRHWTTTHLP